MKTTGVLPVALGLLLGAPVVTACGDPCTDRLDVDLPVGSGNGDHSFTGTADGAEFRCEYSVYLPGFEERALVSGSCSEGPVALRIDRDVVTARFEPTPARVDYRLQFINQPGSMPITGEGTLEPVYSDVGCRTAEEAL